MGVVVFLCVPLNMEKDRSELVPTDDMAET